MTKGTGIFGNKFRLFAFNAGPRHDHSPRRLGRISARLIGFVAFLFDAATIIPPLGRHNKCVGDRVSRGNAGRSTKSPSEKVAHQSRRLGYVHYSLM